MIRMRNTQIRKNFVEQKQLERTSIEDESNREVKQYYYCTNNQERQRQITWDNKIRSILFMKGNTWNEAKKMADNKKTFN